MLRRGLVLDLSVAFGLGTASGYLWWYASIRFPRPRRPPSRSLLRQARRPACRFHGPGLKPLPFPTIRIPKREGGNYVQQRHWAKLRSESKAMRMRF
ncbi:hypothetical protein E4T50_01720 [Aureobasidium sp. EXF-12298]|nr:hypothetical protein E4T50_01720 [Aureobasidium sp. EXF-12298]